MICMDSQLRGIYITNIIYIYIYGSLLLDGPRLRVNLMNGKEGRASLKEEEVCAEYHAPEHI